MPVPNPPRHQNTPAAYLILLQEEKVLLLRRKNTGFEDGNYGLVAGHVDPGESFTQCIIREAQEEAGLFLRAEDLKVVHMMHRNSQRSGQLERVDVFFVAQKWDGVIENREPDKCDDLSWFNLKALPSNTIDYIQQTLIHLQSGIYYSEWGWKES